MVPGWVRMYYADPNWGQKDRALVVAAIVESSCIAPRPRRPQPSSVPTTPQSVARRDSGAFHRSRTYLSTLAW